MKSELIVDVQPDEIAIALTEDDQLQEICREKRLGDNFAVGNIYYGRVKKVMPALNAVFVDVGAEKEAFLHYLDLGASFLIIKQYVTKVVSDKRRMPSMTQVKHFAEVGKEGQIADYLAVGDMILVQVIKEPINAKGPRLTAEISLTGRNMVLMPFADKVMVSSKIKRESERSRLKQLLQAIKPKGYGVIVRTVAEDKRSMELDNEFRLLVERWEAAIRVLQQPSKDTLRDGKKNKDVDVRLISEEPSRTIGIIRDVFTPDFTTIQINDESVYNDVKQYVCLIAPEKAKIVKRYKGEQPIFDKYDITRQMKTRLGRTVGFKNGGYLVIDKTEALFAIDVNTGSKKLFEDQEENAFHYNMLAADEIVHQLRLRDIGGIIIIDFVDMNDKAHQEQLYQHVVDLLKRDRAKHNVLPLSKFGLMQITRQRVRPAVDINISELCPTCMGKGHIQSAFLFHEQIEEQIQRLLDYLKEQGKKTSGITLHLHPYIYAYVRKGMMRSLALRWLYKYGVRVQENQGLGMLETRFYSEGQQINISVDENSAE